MSNPDGHAQPERTRATWTGACAPEPTSSFSNSWAQHDRVSTHDPLPADHDADDDHGSAGGTARVQTSKATHDPTATATRFAMRARGVEKPYKLDRRGFRPTGNGNTGRCPHCGKAISHGLPGNPYTRKWQPCQRVEMAAERARLAAQRTPRGRAVEDELSAFAGPGEATA